MLRVVLFLLVDPSASNTHGINEPGKIVDYRADKGSRTTNSSARANDMGGLSESDLRGRGFEKSGGDDEVGISTDVLRTLRARLRRLTACSGLISSHVKDSSMIVTFNSIRLPPYNLDAFSTLFR